MENAGGFLPTVTRPLPFQLLDRYLGHSILQGWLLVLGVLAALFSVFELIVQLDYIGYGSFLLKDAFSFVALTTPKRLADLVPMAALLGSVIAVGQLADHGELTAMRTAALSVRRIALSILSSCMLLMLAATGISEFVAPPLDQYGRIQRFQKIYGNDIRLTKKGFWVRHGQLFVHVGQAFSGGAAADISVFEFDENGLLRQSLRAGAGTIQDGKQWRLTEVEAIVFRENEIARIPLAEYWIDDFLSPAQVSVLELPPDSLSLSDLYAYIRILDRRGQNYERYALALWQKVCTPLTTGMMVLLAISFIFGSTRARSAWERIFWGLLAGTLSHLTGKLLGQFSLVFGLPPLLLIASLAFCLLMAALGRLQRVA